MGERGDSLELAKVADYVFFSYCLGEALFSVGQQGYQQGCQNPCNARSYRGSRNSEEICFNPWALKTPQSEEPQINCILTDKII